jgi:hypothetical protein
MYYYAQPRSAQAHAGFQIEGDGKLHTKPRGFILNYTEAREGKRSERNLANLGPRGPHTREERSLLLAQRRFNYDLNGSPNM